MNIQASLQRLAVFWALALPIGAIMLAQAVSAAPVHLL